MVFLAFVLWFILFAGLFKLSPSFKVETIAMLSDDRAYPKVTLNQEDIIFRANKTIGSNYELDVVLVDENG